MIEYTSGPDSWIELSSGRIARFDTGSGANIDPETVASFGDEWTKFDRFSDTEIQRIGDEYFDLVTAAMLPPDATVLDLGCGSGSLAFLKAKGCIVYGIELSEAAAERALAAG